MTTESTTISVKLDDLTLDQLVEISQGLGRQVDKLREQRAYLNGKIAQRLAAGERNGQASTSDATAPGAVIEASAAG